MDLIITGFVATIVFVVTSAFWCYAVTPKAEQELREQLEEALDLIDDQRNEIKVLLRDNKRMLAALNHYQIKGYTGENGKWIRSR